MKLTAYLKHLIDNRVYRLIDLSNLSGVYLSDLSRILNGKRLCGAGTLAKLLKVLPDEHQTQFLMLWLQDQVPEGFGDKVHIVPASAHLRSEDSIDVGTFEGSIEFLTRLSGRNNSVRSLLMFLASHHKPDAPTP